VKKALSKKQYLKAERERERESKKDATLKHLDVYATFVYLFFLRAAFAWLFAFRCSFLQ